MTLTFHPPLFFTTQQEQTDVTTLDVDQEAVGFLLGARGATLRGLETKHRTFMFFDNDKTEVCGRVCMRGCGCVV